MPDIALSTLPAHSTFEVPVLVDGTESSALLHLGVEVWGADGVTITRADLVSFRADASALPARGSVIVCSDPSAVVGTRTWVVTDRAPLGGDGYVVTWHMRSES